MAKVNQGYPTLLGGVSQQDPVQRQQGQHWEQVNMMADPVRGLTRRPGTLRAAETEAGVGSFPAITTSGTRAYDFRVRGVDYTLTAPFFGNAQVRGDYPDFTCLRKTAAGGEFLPVSFVGDGTRNTALQANGISAAVSIGSVLLLACNAAAPVYTTTYHWQTEDNLSRHIVWVRGGAYSRTFRMYLVRGNQKLAAEYTTLTASYPEVLDTSDLNPLASDYLKQVNDRTNAYNAAATKWIGDALADSSPENIAQKLAQAMIDTGFLAPGALVVVQGSTICITDDTVDDVEIDDGGDNSLMRGVGNTVTAAELLSIVHYPGKVIRVRPNAASDGEVFYMQAISKDGSSGSFTNVSWEECAGVRYTPTEGLFFVTVDDDTCYVASSPASLRTATGSDFPDYVASLAGDENSSPVPTFLAEDITYLGLFQDRLIVGGRNQIATSRPGDYLNFWRGSVLTVAKNDPVRFLVLGGEDDIMRHSVIYDRSLVIFGDKRQYIVDGKRPFEPNSASATVMATYPDAVGAPPVLAGSYLFYGTSRNGFATLNQFAPGQIVESPVSFELSARLKSYIVGNPIEIVAGTLPSRMYIRTDAMPDTVYVYDYTDVGNERKSSAWNKWTFKSGSITGMSLASGFLYFTGLREGLVFADRLPLTSANLAHPFLDSATANGPLGHTGPDDEGSSSFVAEYTGDYAVAYGRAQDYYGGTLDVAEDVEEAWPDSACWEGFLQDGYVTLTSPFFRDKEGVPMLAGRLAVGNVTLGLADTGGVRVAVHSGSGQECWSETLHGDKIEAFVDLDNTRVGPDCIPDCPGWLGYDGYYPSNPEAPFPFDEEEVVFTNTPTGENTRAVYSSGLATPYVAWMWGGYENSSNDMYFELSFSNSSLAYLQDYSVGIGWGPGFPEFTGTFLQDAVAVRPTGNEWTRLGVHYVASAQEVRFYEDGTLLDLTLDTSGITPGSYVQPMVRCASNNTMDGEWRLYTSGQSDLPDGEPRPDATMILYPKEGAGDGLACTLPSASAVCEIEAIEGPLEPISGGCDDDGAEAFTSGIISMSDVCQGTGVITDAAPYETATLTVPVGREARDYRLTVGTYLWAPLTITTVEWVGQYFNRTRRV